MAVGRPGSAKRVAAEAQAQRDLFSGLKRLGVDADLGPQGSSAYLTVVIDHDDTGRLVWAHPKGRDKQTVCKEFLASAGRRLLRADPQARCPATWPTGSTIPVGERCPNAEVCLDPFHVITSSQIDALDEVRRDVWNCITCKVRPARTRQQNSKAPAFALWMNPERLTE